MRHSNRADALVALLLVGVVVGGVIGGGGCGGSAIPFEAVGVGDVDDTGAGPADVGIDAVEVGGADAGPDVCSCAPEEPCSAVAPECVVPECVVDDDCRDADVCTDDRCETDAGVCLHEPVADCCAADADCDDGVDCTRDRCVGKVCEHESQGEGCCARDEDCDDGLRDTLDRCARNRCVHALDDPPSVCSTVADCVPDNPCVAATCVSGLCSYVPVAGQRCCTLAGDCDDADVCTEDYCVDFRCVYTLARQPQPRESWDFDDAASAGELTLGVADGAAWHVTEAAAWSEPRSLRAGDPASDGYGAGDPFTIVMETPSVSFPSGGPASLRFRTLLDIAENPDADRAAVSVVPTGGDPVEVWSNDTLGGSTGGAWSLETVALGDYAGLTVTVRFAFSSDGAPSGGRSGWFLDDVQLVFPCRTPIDNP